MTKPNTTPLILNGKEVSEQIITKIKAEVSNIHSKNKRPPGLSVILVGDNPASHVYVNNKEKACIKIGLHSEVHRLPANTSEEELIDIIKSINKNNAIDGILVQLPLPIHIKAEKIIEIIDPAKDIDGLHPYNLGKLLSGQKCLVPCTPLGVIEILKYYSINIRGMNAVIIGRSTLVGKPLSLLMLNENATVTVAHSKTDNIDGISRTADILISAVGKAKLVKKNWVKPNAIVIDVGINKTLENNKSLLVGDVDFEDVKSNCKAITPVPGGVGPVTVAMLMSNTLQAYKINNNV
ncbi:MAG: bifunctional 5,10-methylene-tetrahydrofolate dehydrogenase/5,10-methylene-tetrahydrofolate cyclohydrolase [Candidatus Melainabacteria bacterium RIFCSPHIGHO2_02_FULL_34_12]|nr:MAG: bifunctional 5,10-methylene-tetrahydrofolate dehydrogenase/5,10-methylene-tetrahydrofolate cyclohydrolase [Candidatus Melainabacteria bacterium RIFCSPHIGHO2_02_FULL_34_12]